MARLSPLPCGLTGRGVCRLLARLLAVPRTRGERLSRSGLGGGPRVRPVARPEPAATSLPTDYLSPLRSERHDTISFFVDPANAMYCAQLLPQLQALLMKTTDYLPPTL